MEPGPFKAGWPADEFEPVVVEQRWPQVWAKLQAVTDRLPSCLAGCRHVLAAGRDGLPSMFPTPS
jgi:hypothetical protein